VSEIRNIALVGNPNCGKTSLFNALTGLNQRVGNYAGVTVESKLGTVVLPNGKQVNIIDLPGTYSLYPKSGDEFVTYDALFDQSPDAIVVLADATNLKRNLLFVSQIIDLGFPVIMALTMNDLAIKKEIKVDIDELAIQLGIPVVNINPRKGKGIKELLKHIAHLQYHQRPRVFLNTDIVSAPLLQSLSREFPHWSDYACIHLAAETEHFHFLLDEQRAKIEDLKVEYGFKKNKIQAQEILQRYQKINSIMAKSVVEEDPLRKELRSERFDKILLHPLYGNIILLIVLFILFQSIFWIASIPMDWIDEHLAAFTRWVATRLPQEWWSKLLTQGILAGIAGILVFIPQIMILFGLITILEDTGYMARISFLTDRLMRSVGLSGRSVMPLISGMACAVPAILSTRTIENLRERLITILITPLMSCSARLPVYTILISLIIPNETYFGFISLRGLIMLVMYLLGFFMALIVAKVSSYLFASKGKSFFLMELPIYKAPRWQNVFHTMIDKAKIFVWDAGKIILLISVILWFLCSYGPGEKREVALENSYAGWIGKKIEPIFTPIGFDWKMDIAMITSFAAREVFVGSMATLYSVEEDADEKTLLQKMENASRPDGSPVYTLATGMSLMLFYVFAMQCMSTMAIVKRETKSWKWPILQFIVMFFIAYAFSFLAYQVLK
jgi:ferrous iron transport protein B